MRTWLSSLRVRLAATYLLVVAISFLFFSLLLARPVERFLMRREENTLAWTGHTLGTTLRTPWNVSPEIWAQDQFWTQRRSADLAASIGARIRLLDAQGRVLTDSHWGHPGLGEWKSWQQQQAHAPTWQARPEVQQAILGHYCAFPRTDDDGGKPAIFIAKPILRYDPRAKMERVAFIMYLNRPVESVRNDLHALRRLVTLGMIAGMLVALLASIMLSSNLSAGLQAAMRVARAFAAGKMDQRMHASGRDEVGQLGAAFNQMADALQRQEQLRRDLLADVSHELRTPLTAITGCADTLLDGALRDDPAAAERFLTIMARESGRLQRLVTDILELSKLQAGAVPIPRVPLPLAPIVEDAVEIAGLHARQQDVTIRLHLPDETPITILGNEDRLAQALRNLLDNALHHTPRGKTITVTVTAGAREATIAIQDEGEGIPPDDLPWVFDRFYRSGTGGAKAGAGLGLAITREIVLAHEGRVEVASTVGVGTTFSLHLPCAG